MLMSKQALFFGDQNDFMELVSLIDKGNQLNYCLAGLWDQEDIRSYSSLLEVPLFGTTKETNREFCPGFVVSFRHTSINAREVKQSKGGVKYAFDQLINPKSVIFRPGGPNGEANLLIEGNVSTVSDDPESIQVYNVLVHAIRKLFKKKKNVYIGKGAYELYKNGWRLTHSMGAPVVYDFREE
jgi:hypothetical protein